MQNALANHLFQSILVPKQGTGIFEVLNTWMNLCNNMVEEKAREEKQNSKKGFEKNEHAYIVEGVSWVLDSTAYPYLRWRAQLGKFKARLRSDRSESEKQKSQTRLWGSLA